MIRTETKAGSVNVSGEKRKIGKKVFPHSNFSGFFLQIFKKKKISGRNFSNTFPVLSEALSFHYTV